MSATIDNFLRSNLRSSSSLWNLSCCSVDRQLERTHHLHVGRKDSPGKYRDCPLRPVSCTKHQTIGKASQGPRAYSCPFVGLFELGQKKSGAEAPLFIWCRRGDLNPHALAGAGPLSRCVCRFRHFDVDVRIPRLLSESDELVKQEGKRNHCKEPNSCKDCCDPI